MRRTVEIIQRGIEEGLHPGAQLFVRRLNELVIDEAFGEARPGVPMRSDSVVLWMSAGKPITAVAILQLIEEGRLALDTRVADVVPEFGINGKEAITVRHCLTHTAGFRGPLNNFTPGPWEDIISRVCALRQEPNWMPGEKAGYHVGSSWFLLGEIVRRIDGVSFEQAIRTRVMNRIGANDSYIGLEETRATDFGDRMALMWLTDRTPATHEHPANTPDGYAVPRPGANLIGPARDLGEFYQALLDQDGRLLKPVTSREMVSRQRVGMFDETFKQIVDWGWGFKLDSKRYGKPESYGYGPHASDATFGHSGNQCSCAFADPKHDLVVAWCTTGMPGELKHQQRQNAINAAIYEDLGLT